MTEHDLKHYRTLLKSEHATWTKADVEVLVAEVERLQALVPTDDQPVALRDHWAQRTRFVGGH